MESAGFEPMTQFYRPQDSVKPWISRFQANFPIEGLMGRGLWQHLETLLNLYFKWEKVPSLLFYAESGN